MKRSHEDITIPRGKKQRLSDDEAHDNFRSGLFDDATRDQYARQYAASTPYKHGVIAPLVNEDLLRSVRTEICDTISFTRKETDIYKIHQSGDLANLDGLDDASLKQLPSLLKLRDSLYSAAFRNYLSAVTGSGPLSGLRTDMAVNVYTPGCHLLCHDDVIGTRRLSWILYLLDPNVPWKPEWGGALRLYPIVREQSANAESCVHGPSPDFSVSIPPAWNQLAFFTVQPGESFHDVEEVYDAGPENNEENKQHVRMAISGWFHIPQEGEAGYDADMEAKLAERSSLAQLQGGEANWFDRPSAPDIKHAADKSDPSEADLTASDIDLLLKYLKPQYLTPDTVEQLSTMFADDSSLHMADILSSKFSSRLRLYLQSKDHEASPSLSGDPNTETPQTGVARPPHKHRYLYRHARGASDAASELSASESPYDELVDVLFPNPAFHKWLALVAGMTITESMVLARRFRRGHDYTLATVYEKSAPQLEVCLDVSPSWHNESEGAEDQQVEEDGAQGSGQDLNTSSSRSLGSKSANADPDYSLGGYMMYMAGGEDDEQSREHRSAQPSTHTGAGHRRKTAPDPAVYRASADADDGVLFAMPAGWNQLSIVLRDRGVMRFVKYISRAAKGDRWDVFGEFAGHFESDDEEGDDEESKDHEESSEAGNQE